MNPDPYEVLGVEHGADDEAVKRAYRDQARQMHPDASDQRDATERMQALNAAWSVLGNPRRRAAFDAWLARAGLWRGAPPDVEPANLAARARTARERAHVRHEALRNRTRAGRLGRLGLTLALLGAVILLAAFLRLT